MTMIKTTIKKNENREAEITVFLSAPQLQTGNKTGVSFKTVESIVLAKTIVSYSEMSAIMKFHDVKTWKDLAKVIDKKYNHFYHNRFFD